MGKKNLLCRTPNNTWCWCELAKSWIIIIIFFCIKGCSRVLRCNLTWGHTGSDRYSSVVLSLDCKLDALGIVKTWSKLNPKKLNQNFWTWKPETVFSKTLQVITAFPGDSDSKESTFNAGDLGSIPELRKLPGYLQVASWRRAWQPTPGFVPGESPQTEEPGRLQSMGLQRVGQDWATKHSTGDSTV